MPYTRGMATKLLTATELNLFDAARRAEMTSHSAPQLHVKIGRARRLRDRRVAAAKVASPPANLMSEAARGANARAVPVRTGGVAVQAHVSSRGRRNQAKRDGRP